MTVHRSLLPLVYQCEGFIPAPGSVGEGGFCERCERHVHDVSALRESELRRLLAAHAGQQVCLSYRTDARGRVLLRPEPAPLVGAWQALALGALALLLAACAGHARELEAPGMGGCRDEDGYEVACPEWSEPGMLSVPESDALAEVAVEEPTRSAPPGLEVGDVPTDAPADPRLPGDGVAPPAGTSTAAPSTTAGIRVDFAIDRYVGHSRGIVVVVGQVEPKFVPTAQLVEEWRGRRAERRRQRELRLASARGTAAQ